MKTLMDYDSEFRGCEYAFVQTVEGNSVTSYVIWNSKPTAEIHVHKFEKWEETFKGNLRLSEMIQGELMDIKFMDKYD